jgi:UDP-sulfoquinovose synthase
LNQFTEQFSVLELAHMVKTAARQMGLRIEIEHLPSPRVDAEENYYNAKNSRLIDLGLRPHFLGDSLLDSLMNIALKYQDRVDVSLFHPQVEWRKSRNQGRRVIADAVLPVPADA